MCHKVERPIVERREKSDIDSAHKKKMSESIVQNQKINLVAKGSPRPEK
jgi:hypothetical protein